MPSAIPKTIAEAIRAADIAEKEKEAVDRLASEAVRLAEKAAQFAEAAQERVRTAKTPEEEAAAIPKALKAGKMAQRAAEVCRMAEKTAARKAETEKAAKTALRRLQTEAGRSSEPVISGEAADQGPAKPQPGAGEEKKAGGALRWFPGVTIPLIFVLILAFGVYTAAQSNYSAQWSVATDWFRQTFLTDEMPAKAGMESSAMATDTENGTVDCSGLPGVGMTVATDRIQVTLKTVCFSDVVILRNGNWLNRLSESGVAAGDGSTFICFSFIAANLSEVPVKNSEFCNVTVEFNGKRYTGADFGFVETAVTGDGDTVSNEIRDESLASQQSREYYGFIPCAAEVKTSSDGPLLNFVLAGSGGETEFTFTCEGGYTGADEEAVKVAQIFLALEDDLITIRDHVGEVDAEGSRAFDTEIIQRTRNALDELDEDYVNLNLPETAARLHMIQSNLKSICDKLEVMSISNSAGNVEKIRSLTNRTLALIGALFDSELEAYR